MSHDSWRGSKKHSAKPGRHERLRGRAWQEARERIRHLRPLCPRCEAKGRVSAGIELDHRLPLFMGGTNDDENLDLLCVPCHWAKTLEERGLEARGCDVDGWPTGEGHHWHRG